LKISNALYITIDTDWAPDYILEYCFKLISNKKIKATMFATNKSKILDNLDKNRFKIGLHPNFSDFIHIEEEIQRLKNMFPDAISLRNHSLCHSSHFFPVFNKMGIKFISNYLAPFCKNLTPIVQPFGVIEYPIYFMDDAYQMMYNKKNKYELSSLDLHSPGLKVFAFHPIHIYLNSDSVNEYEKIKKYYDNPQKLSQYINPNLGIRNLFQSLIEHISDNSIETFTLT